MKCVTFIERAERNEEEKKARRESYVGLRRHLNDLMAHMKLKRVFIKGVFDPQKDPIAIYLDIFLPKSMP